MEIRCLNFDYATREIQVVVSWKTRRWGAEHSEVVRVGPEGKIKGQNLADRKWGTQNRIKELCRQYYDGFVAGVMKGTTLVALPIKK